MKKNSLLVIAGTILGFVVGISLPLVADSHDSSNVDGSWQIQSAPFGQQSFYVVKHNTVSGETLVLSAERGINERKDKWAKLGVRDETKN